jgi:hypothetical protein
MADHESFKEKLKNRLWAEFQRDLGGRRYTPTPNAILDARIRDTTLELGERFDSLLERKSFGNWNVLFACERNWDTGATTTLGQEEFATILGVDKRRISEVVELRRKQGYVKMKALPSDRSLASVLDPRTKLSRVEPEEPGLKWEEFKATWEAEHPKLVERRAELLALTAPLLAELATIDKASIADFKKARRAASKTQSTVPDERDAPADEGSDPPSIPVQNGADYGSETARTAVRNGADNSSETARTEKTASSHGHGIDPRVREENSKQLDLNTPSSSSSAVSSSVQANSSVGRSFAPTPTDRPSDESINPFQAKIREWMESPESHISIPGFSLEETELNQIAATIQTDQHFEQFKQAVLRQKNPRGWIVFVKIALACQKRQNQYAGAAAAGAGEEESRIVKNWLERQERQKRTP